MRRVNLGSEQLREKDRAHLFHPSTQLAAHARGEIPNRIVTGAEGVYVWDSEGRRSLDAFGGLYCVNIGYGCREIVDAIVEQAETLPFYHVYAGHGTEPAILLADKIVQLFGQRMRTVYFGLSGSDANETNIKLAWYYNNVLTRPQKKKIISRKRAYHGSGLMTGSLTGLPFFQQQFDLPLTPVRHTTTPHYYRQARKGEDERAFSKRCAAELNALILEEGPDTVAAFIGEPVLGTGGIVPPPEGYWEEIQKVLREHDVLLIADEVVTGFGRTGEMFACHKYGLQPDIVTIAKGVSSAYLPISGSIIGERVWKVLEEGTDRHGPFGHGWTYSAHTLCAAAALANLEQLEAKRIVEHARAVGAYFQDRLHDAFADHPIVGEVRGVGLLGAIEFMADKADRRPFDPDLKVGPRIAAALLEKGVIARAMPHGDILGFSPPLIISQEEIDIVIEATAAAIGLVAGELAGQS